MGKEVFLCVVQIERQLLPHLITSGNMFRTALANTPRSSASGQLLRPTRSLGALRSSAVNHASIHAAQPPVPTRGLVSTVLLTRDSYDAKNVQQLKAECKQRGLTTGGKRTDIVARLLNDDAVQSGSGITTEPSSSSLSPSRSSKARGAASLASLRSGDKAQQQKEQQPSSSLKGTPKKPAPAPARPSPATEASPATSSAQTGGASIPHPTTIKPGQVQTPGSAQTSSTDAGLSSPDTKLSPDSNPPGVPPQNEPKVPETFKVDIPYEQAAPQPGPEIPIVTAYTSNRDFDTSSSAEPSTPAASAGPRVVTASGESDVVHALDLNSSAAVDPSPASDALSSAARSIKNDLGLTGDLSAQKGALLNSTAGLRAKASQATSAFFADAQSSLANLASAAPSIDTAGDASSTSTSGGKGQGRRPMNADERRGVYVLGGLVLGGFTLGSFGKPKKAVQKH
ncbi:unnamed protein product [Sympodiomycopsis kandeliae]